MDIVLYKSRVRGGPGIASLAIIGAGFGVYGLLHCTFKVDQKQHAVVVNRISGVKSKVYGQGEHLILPFFERPVIYPVRSHSEDIYAVTRDLQTVEVSLVVFTLPLKKKLTTVHTNLGENYGEIVLPSILGEAVCSLVAQYVLSELIDELEVGAVEEELKKEIEKRGLDFHILIEDVRVVNLFISEGLLIALKARQQTQLESTMAIFDVEKAMLEKKLNVIKAQGESECAYVFGKSGNLADYLSLRRLEAYLEVVHALPPDTPINLDLKSLIKVNESRESETVKQPSVWNKLKSLFM